MANSKKSFDQMRREYATKIRLEKKERGISQNKYNAKIVAADGKGNPGGSQFERSVLALYRLLEKAGEITELRHQHQVRFSEADISWRLDFSFLRQGEMRYAEAKGFETADYLLKLRCWRIWGPGPLELWKGNAQHPYLEEVIMPKYYVAKMVTLP